MNVLCGYRLWSNWNVIVKIPERKRPFCENKKILNGCSGWDLNDFDKGEQRPDKF